MPFLKVPDSSLNQKNLTLCLYHFSFHSLNLGFEFAVKLRFIGVLRQKFQDAFKGNFYDSVEKHLHLPSPERVAGPVSTQTTPKKPSRRGAPTAALRCSKLFTKF